MNVAAYVDRSRDRAVEDPTNLFIVHPLARRLLPIAVGNGISANAVSIAGLCIGTGAALCYFGWADWRLASLGFFLTIWWLVADGLDGMVARATGSASPLGRILDGICDHGVFALLYLALALSIGTAEGWATALIAAAFHAVQSSLYEAERIRYHRRLRGDPLPAPPLPTRNPLVRAYEGISGSLDKAAEPFDRHLAVGGDPAAAIARYRRHAMGPMKLLSLLSSNVRVIAIYLACLGGDPVYFWQFEIIALSAVAFSGILWHRRAEQLSARISAT